MKKMILAAVLVFAIGCGKKVEGGTTKLPALESELTALEGKAKEYCACLADAKGTIKSCNATQIEIADGSTKLEKEVTDSYIKHGIEKADYDRIKKAGAAAFDKKAECAKKAMAAGK